MSGAFAGKVVLATGGASGIGPAGIRVDGVAPGLIAMRFHDSFTPADVAGAVLCLASERASFLTGELIEVNGGPGLY